MYGYAVNCNNNNVSKTMSVINIFFAVQVSTTIGNLRTFVDDIKTSKYVDSMSIWRRIGPDKSDRKYLSIKTLNLYKFRKISTDLIHHIIRTCIFQYNLLVLKCYY